MCGICGIYNKNSQEIVQETIIKMRDVMLNRGPDEAGLYIAPYIGLGHRKLNLTSISHRGHQPISNEDGTLRIVMDGRIYNFLELLSALVEKGHKFISQTDPEVLIHGYEEWGIDGLLKRINGMFAFAIWDSRHNELILVRDRFGEKPLFYMENNGKIYFASDIKSIYIGYNNNLTIDYEAIDYFLHSYCIPQEYSIFKEIKKVFPAHYVRFGMNKKSSNCYWYLSFAPKLKMEENEYIENIKDILVSAIKRRISNNASIGIFLSGGVDSSLLVALTANISDLPVKTFSMGVEEESYNELKYARKVAERCSTEHHELIVEPDALNILPEIIWAYGEPFADSSQIPTYYLSRIAKEHVNVVLNGEGGDEAFCGYSSVARYLKHIYRKYVPPFLRKDLLPSISNSLISIFGQRGIIRKFNTLTESGRESFIDTFKMSNVFGFKHKDKLYTYEFKENLSSYKFCDIYEKYFYLADGINEIDKEHFIQIKTRLPNDYLTKMDVATMMNSLEARSPFLDYELMEFTAGIPTNSKVKHGKEKFLLKKLAGSFVPHEVIYRKKWGFGIPIKYWLREKYGVRLKEILLSERAKKRGYFEVDYINKLIDEHLTGKFDHSSRLWALLCFELWHLMFIDKILKPETKLT